MRDANGRFQKGHGKIPGAGRKAGVPNKANRDIRLFKADSIGIINGMIDSIGALSSKVDAISEKLGISDAVDKYYVYGHYTDAGRLFYIGKGKGKRAWDFSSKSRNAEWSELAEKNGCNVRIFAENLQEKQALSVESQLIVKYSDDLVNKSVGINKTFNRFLETDVKLKYEHLSALRR